MSSSPETISLERALQFCLFSNLSIFIYPLGQRNLRVNAQVIDIHPDGIEVLIENPTVVPEDIQLFSSEIGVVFPFRQKSASFVSKIKNGTLSSAAASTLIIENPGTATLQNDRVFPRTPLLELEQSYVSHIEVQSKLGKQLFESSILVNYSQHAIAIAISRDQGLALPGDRVINLEIHDKMGRPILRSSGAIARTDMKYRAAGSNTRTYLVVIKSEKKPTGIVSDKVKLPRASRVCLLDDSAFILSKHPFFPAHEIRAQIADISPSGLSILIDHLRFPLMEGMILDKVKVQLPFHNVSETSLLITRCQKLENENKFQYRLGTQFIDLSPQLHKSISQVVQNKTSPSLIDANSDDYEQLWEFFFETGFVYGDKRKQLQEYATKLFKTYSRILESNSPIVKKILFKENGTIKGHVSGIKFFDNAWLIQHLNALKANSTQSAAQAVIHCMADFFLETKVNNLIETSFITCYFRPDNLYPAIVFGETRNLANDRTICDIADLNFCTVAEVPQIQAVKSQQLEVNVAPASEHDLLDLETLLIEQGKWQLVKLEGLEASRITQLKVSPEFEKIGLYRYRQVLVARSTSSSAIAYAVCNFASPGINLSELTNSFRIFYSRPTDPGNQILADRVSETALSIYAETEMKYPVYLGPTNEPIPSQFEFKKIYSYWYFDTDHMRLFKDTTQSIFENIKFFIQKFTDEQNRKSA
jgi:hypothetical protein